ncbi:MAG: hypothetical protein Q6373_004845 [Candidatus Sigynarchaeota archaeon]
MDKASIRRFLSGAFPARYAIPYVIVVYATFTTLILISTRFYIGDYSFVTNSVSNLGDPLLNPFPGWLFFSMALWSFGFMAMPLFLYQGKRLVAGQRHRAIIFMVFSTIACAGSIGVGIFSEVEETFPSHVVSAVMAFGGLFLAAFFTWVPCFSIAARNQQKRIRTIKFAITVVQMIAIILTAAVTATVYVQAEIFGNVGGGFLSVTFWEWMLMFCIGAHVFLLTVNVSLDSR